MLTPVKKISQHTTRDLMYPFLWDKQWNFFRIIGQRDREGGDDKSVESCLPTTPILCREKVLEPPKVNKNQLVQIFIFHIMETKAQGREGLGQGHIGGRQQSRGPELDFLRPWALPWLGAGRRYRG